MGNGARQARPRTARLLDGPAGGRQRKLSRTAVDRSVVKCSLRPLLAPCHGAFRKCIVGKVVGDFVEYGRGMLGEEVAKCDPLVVGAYFYIKAKFLALLTIVTPLSLGAEILSIGSPDGRNRVSFEKPGKELTYTIDRDGKQLILPSRAGLHVDNRVWEMALGKRDLAQPDCWMDLLEAQFLGLSL